MSYQNILERVFERALAQKASDIHISTGRHPIIRVDGVLISLEKEKILNSSDTEGLALIMLGEKKDEFFSQREIDISYEYRDKARFRVNLFFQQNCISIAMRFIPRDIRSIDDLGLPNFLHSLTEIKQGLVLITGPTGHGKTTTLAAIVDEINHKSKEDHIITIEDPIEYIFTQDKSIIDQREVGGDTKSFVRALKSTLRQDPDIIMVGEMRDYESISIALTAAETGHLVLSTLHTNSAAQTIDRIIDVFPVNQQHQARIQLAATISGIVSQRLIRRVDSGRVPVCEIMTGIPSIRNIIREERTHELDMVISTSSEKGMISLNRSLANLVMQRIISLEDALGFSLNPSELKLMLKRA